MGGKVSKEPEREYFCRFAQGIVGTSTVILRDVLRSYVPCTDLLDALNHRAVPLKLNKRQKDLVKNAATKGYKEFDISFLYYLLRNLCSNLSNLENLTNPRISTENLPQPSKGWDKEPLPLNISLSDDIERIRLLRNEAFAHIPHAKLSKDEYDIYWGKLKDICSRCKSHYRLRQFKHDYKKELRHLEKYNPKDKKAEIIVNTVSEMHAHLVTQIDQHERQLGLQNCRLADLQLRFQVLETASQEAVHIWKIEDYFRRKHDAIAGRTLSLYSQPFHTGRFGYKMCSKVYLNGDGIGRGTHLSLFFVVMKGEYDALLPWPFKQKVTLMLLDQDTRTTNISYTIQPQTTSSSFNRPKTFMNETCGCSTLVSHGCLETNTYLRDDTIFIRIDVETTGLQQTFSSASSSTITGMNSSREILYSVQD